MPRTSNQTRFNLFLPSSLYEQATLLAAHEDTPLAEFVRRAADILLTYQVPKPDAPQPPSDSLQRFVVHVPQPMLDRMEQIAAHRGQNVHELWAVALLAYATRKLAVVEILNRSAPAPAPVPAASEHPRH